MMNKELTNQNLFSTQGQVQIKASFTNNFLKQRVHPSGQKDFNQEMMKLMSTEKQQQYLNKVESLAIIPQQERQQGSRKSIQQIVQSQQNQAAENQNEIDRNLYLKAQQKLYSQNVRIPSKILSFNETKDSNVNQQDNVKDLTSNNPKNIKISNFVNSNLENESQKVNCFADFSTAQVVDSPFNKTKQNLVQTRKVNHQNYFSQSLISSKFRDSQFLGEKKDLISKSPNPKQEKEEDKPNQKIDPLSRVRLLKNSSPQSSLPPTFSLSQSSLIEKNNPQQNNKKMQIKDIKFESIFIDNTGSHLSNSNQNLIVQSKQGNNGGSKNLGSQRNFLNVIQNDTNKSQRSHSQSQQNNLNKRRYSANVNQQIQTPSNNQEEKKGFTSFLTDYLSNLKDVVLPNNNLLSPIDKITHLNPNLIKRALVMSSTSKMNSDNQQFFSAKNNNNKNHYSSFSQTQTHIQTYNQDNSQPGQISIQALIPSQPSKLTQQPVVISSSINININSTNRNSFNQNEYQIFSIQDIDSNKNKNNYLHISKNIPSSLQELQIIKSEEDLKPQEQNSNFKNLNKIKMNLQSPKSLQDAINNFKVTHKVKLPNNLGHSHTFLNHISNLDEYSSNNHKMIKSGIHNGFLKNKEYEESTPQMRQDSKESLLQKSDKIQRKNQEFKSYPPISEIKGEIKSNSKDAGFYSLSTRRTNQQQAVQNSSSSQYLLSNRNSLSSLQNQPKKKFLSFQSQRDLPTSDTSYNQIDIAPFSNQNKENTHLQNLMQKVDQGPNQITQNSHQQYRFLKQNISLDKSFDNEDEDFYNYTQNVKIQSQNSPQNINLNIDFL